MNKELLRHLFLIICLFSSITASADDNLKSTSTYDFESKGIYYHITSENDKTVEVTNNAVSNIFYSGAVDIPKSVKYKGTTYSVTKISMNAFEECKEMTSIEIPNTVTEIGEFAFFNCLGLKSITIPSSVKKIGNNTFAFCSNLQKISIPNSLIEVGFGAFDDTAWFENQPDGVLYTGLVAYKYKGEMPKGTSITIKEGTKTIADEAFTFCYGLTSVVIPSSVTKIGNIAFYRCTRLSNITFPMSIVEIGREAFGDTPWVENQPDGIIYIGMVAYKYKGEMPNNTSITIKEGTKMISGKAFSYCNNLTSIEIPNTVANIGDFAFFNCLGLTSISIPSSVTEIGWAAYAFCSNLKEIYNNSKSPQLIDNITFEYVDSSCILYVPKGSVGVYRASNIWKDFLNIKDF